MSPDLDSRTVSRPLVCQRGHAGACTTSSGARRRVARRLHPRAMLLLIASFAGLGGFLFGYDLGLIAGALVYMEASLHLRESSEEVIVGDGQARRRVRHVRRRRADARRRSPPRHRVEQRLFPPRSSRHGGRLGPVALSLGRFVVGLGAGASAVVVPAYVAEMSPPSAAAPSSSPTNSCSASA